MAALGSYEISSSYISTSSSASSSYGSSSSSSSSSYASYPDGGLSFTSPFNFPESTSSTPTSSSSSYAGASSITTSTPSVTPVLTPSPAAYAATSYMNMVNLTLNYEPAGHWTACNQVTITASGGLGQPYRFAGWWEAGGDSDSPTFFTVPREMASNVWYWVVAVPVGGTVTIAVTDSVGQTYAMPMPGAITSNNGTGWEDTWCQSGATSMQAMWRSADSLMYQVDDSKSKVEAALSVLVGILTIALLCVSWLYRRLRRQKASSTSSSSAPSYSSGSFSEKRWHAFGQGRASEPSHRLSVSSEASDATATRTSVIEGNALIRSSSRARSFVSDLINLSSPEDDPFNDGNAVSRPPAAFRRDRFSASSASFVSSSSRSLGRTPSPTRSSTTSDARLSTSGHSHTSDTTNESHGTSVAATTTSFVSNEHYHRTKAATIKPKDSPTTAEQGYLR